jgi:hypothetical protein
MNTHRGITVRLICTAGCTLSLCLPLCVQTVNAQTPAREGYRPPQPSPGPSLHSPLDIFFGATGGTSAGTPNRPNPPPKPGADSLLKDGPQFPASLSVGAFSVVGFTRGGWPFVIDFLPQPDSCTWLAVSTGEKSYPSVLLDPDGHAGRRVVKVNLPDEIGPNIQAGEYAVYSEQGACAPNPVGGTQTARPFSPITIYGLGAGPRAVGSIAVNSLQFGPSTPHFPQESATFGYTTINDFGRVSQEILSFEEKVKGQWSVQTIRTTQLDALQKGKHSGSWDGTDGTGTRAPGVYRLQVRVWNTLNDEKSWGGAISPDSVHIVKQ